MPWVRFMARFLWSPPPYGQRRTILYEPGQHLLVTTACARAAIEIEAAEPAEPKRRDEDGRRR